MPISHYYLESRRCEVGRILLLVPNVDRKPHACTMHARVFLPTRVRSMYETMKNLQSIIEKKLVRKIRDNGDYNLLLPGPKVVHMRL